MLVTIPLCVSPIVSRDIFRSVADEEVSITDENMRDKCEELFVVDEKVLVSMSIYNKKHALVPMLEIHPSVSIIGDHISI